MRFCRYCCVISLYLCLLLIASTTFASAFTVEASGGTEEETLGNICRKALAAYIAGRIGEKPYDENREKIEKAILDSCSEYVLNIEVLDKKEGEDVSVVIKGRAIIDDVPLLAKLKSMGIRPEERRSVVVFASEKILGEWISSYVSTMFEDEVQFNECEAVIGESFRDKGFDEIDISFTGEQKAKARKLKGVFGRYRDVSTMPNETVARASAIVDGDAGYVVACRVIADSGREKDSAFMYSCCAEASCKVVDTNTERRFATASESLCVPHANRTTGSITAIRQVCSKIGEGLAKKLEKGYKK